PAGGGAIMTAGCEAGCRIEINADGYLRLDGDAARRFFPDDLLVLLTRADEMLLLPTRGGAAGGLILKQRNAQGDRSVLIAEAFGFAPPAGSYDAVWDDAAGGLRITMRPRDRVDIPRPQPVGLAPFPESHLLVPGRATLARGPADLIDAYNRFVRLPTPLGLATLVAAGDPAIAALARAAAFAHGLVDDLPEPGPLDGELEALVLMTAAAGLIERGDRAEACRRLSKAVESAREVAPGFAAVLEMQLADLLSADEAIGHLENGLRLAEHVQEPLVKAELWTKLGFALQQAGAGDRAALLKAVAAYQQALQCGVTEDGQPDWFGQIQNNLGLAYLSIPLREASDQLRAGIAVQSFRHALKIYDRETHPDMWATVSMNLANALQYLPSSHQAENLMQAVDIYEAVLEVRTDPRDPVAHALVLLNQANALAHLGIFKPAIEKAAHAYTLFMWYGQLEQAAAAKELHDTLQ
ncbi:MAG: hypothetical protein ACK48M_09250, partial [Planctomycetia bacterium]